jgi:hypothetical protein
MPGEARFPTTRVCQAPVGSYSSNVLLSLSPKHVTLLREIVGLTYRGNSTQLIAIAHGRDERGALI